MQKPEIEYKKEPKYASSHDMLRLAQENEAKGEQTSVYDWKFPKVLDAPIPMREVAPKVKQLRELCVRLNSKHPSWTDDQVREHIKTKHADFKDMADRTHPHLFLMLTERNLSDNNFRRITDLLTIRVIHEQNNNLDANTKLISSWFQHEFIPTPKK
jgi:hypothetical protein